MKSKSFIAIKATKIEVGMELANLGTVTEIERPSQNFIIFRCLSADDFFRTPNAYFFTPDSTLYIESLQSF